jgi:hypothetical protein
MKKSLLSALICVMTLTRMAIAQELTEKHLPESVKAALVKKFPDAKKVKWEKEKGNFEANWGGKSGEDSSAVFTPSANFIEIVVAIPVNQLPESVAPYVHKNYQGAKILEAGKVIDSTGKHFYEAEIKGKDLIFDENGVFLKED